MIELVDGVPVCFGCFSSYRYFICLQRDCKFVLECEKETHRMGQIFEEMFRKHMTKRK